MWFWALAKAIPGRVWAILAGLVAIVLVGWGLYRYGVTVGTAATEKAQAAVAMEAEERGRASERKLVADQMAAADALHRQLEVSIRATREQQAALRREVAAWAARPVPTRIVRMLDAPRPGVGGADSPSASGGHPPRADDPVRGSAVDPGVLADAVRENSGRCERNIARLNACIAAYDRAKEAIERFSRGQQ